MCGERSLDGLPPRALRLHDQRDSDFGWKDLRLQRQAGPEAVLEVPAARSRQLGMVVTWLLS